MWFKFRNIWFNASHIDLVIVNPTEISIRCNGDVAVTMSPEGDETIDALAGSFIQKINLHCGGLN